MTIKIGEKSLTTSRVGLEEKLIESTGCNVAEWASMLAGSSTAGQVARVLGPMLTEPMAPSDLADAVNAAGVDGVRADVLALLTSAPEPASILKGAKADGGA